MKKILLKILGILGLLFLSIVLVYASVTTASSRKSTKLPWQGTHNLYYDSAHNVGTSYVAEARFTSGGSGVVYDSVTGLYWQIDGGIAGVKQWAIHNIFLEPTWNTSTKTYTYPNGKSSYPAFAYCEDLTLGTYDDWRLPTYKELDSIVDYTIMGNPRIDTTYFIIATNVHSRQYWSSTISATDTLYAWIVNFGSGNSKLEIKTDSRSVRCVR